MTNLENELAELHRKFHLWDETYTLDAVQFVVDRDSQRLSDADKVALIGMALEAHQEALNQ